VIIDGRVRDIGGFPVRRVLPVAARRSVGPFVFLDHMGPLTAAMNVAPHPHIGLATVTYLFEGAIVHRDSLATTQTITPGAVNWMVAGRGVVHSERSTQVGPVHGVQSWVALPAAHEEDAPSFAHHPAASLPELERPGVRLRLLAGAAYGAEAPVAVLAPTFYVDARLEAGAELPLPEEHAERAAYVVDGALDGVGPGQMQVFAAGGPATVRALGPTRVMLLGGAPLDGPRHIFWNFVSSSKGRIDAARADWSARRFPHVPGDEHDRVELPPWPALR
jgi:redox-sensitive bicupin YhaK (pirin superfamily)